MNRRVRARLPALRWALLAALGIAGVVLGHALGYRLAHPHGHERHLALVASGHGYWSLAIQAAILGAVVALLGHLALGAFHGRRRVRSVGRLTVREVFVRLSAVQLGIFTALEVTERLATGAGLPVVEVAFWLGLPIQVAVAGLGAVALQGAEEAGARLVRSRRFRGPKRALARLVPPRRSSPFSRDPFGEFSARAPPTAVRSA